MRNENRNTKSEILSITLTRFTHCCMMDKHQTMIHLINTLYILIQITSNQVDKKTTHINQSYVRELFQTVELVRKGMALLQVSNKTFIIRRDFKLCVCVCLCVYVCGYVCVCVCECECVWVCVHLLTEILVNLTKMTFINFMFINMSHCYTVNVLVWFHKWSYYHSWSPTSKTVLSWYWS